MKVTHIGNKVTGINRSAIEGESEISITPQDLTKGMDVDLYTVEGGVLIPKSDEVLAAVELERAKLAQKAIIKAAKENDPSNGLTVSLPGLGQDVKVDCYKTNQDDFKQGYEYAIRNSLTESTLRDYDNVEHTIPVSDLNVIVNAIQDYYIGIINKKWSKDAAIEACTSIAEVEAITWSNS